MPFDEGFGPATDIAYQMSSLRRQEISGSTSTLSQMLLYQSYFTELGPIILIAQYFYSHQVLPIA